VLADSAPADWQALDPEHTLYLELESGRVVIELAPAFAPLHAANIKALVRESYFDDGAIVRVHDNYVTQWGQPDEQREMGPAKASLEPEFARPLDEDRPFTRLPDGDVYAPEVGFSDGWAIARDPNAGREWLTHCYGMLGVGRGNETGSGSGNSLYAVIGHGPRHLDLNITLAGRVVQGMELLSALPRGTGTLGFYERSEQFVQIRSLRVAADLPPEQRTELEVMRTGTRRFADYVEALRNRGGEWFAKPAGSIDICNVRIPIRERAAAGN
jgi:cyclophilin family peptidyl-prolyl cis-trans isomerase